MARDELFDMAVARAAEYARRLGTLGERDEEQLRSVLEVWYLKTRFAYRVPLEEVVHALAAYPGRGHEWRGGRAGAWQTAEGR